MVAKFEASVALAPAACSTSQAGADEADCY